MFKIGKNFSALPSLINRLYMLGIDGVVLFNRYYQPDIDIYNLSVGSANVFSHSSDLSDTLRWTAIVSSKIPNISLSASSGVHTWEDVVKCILAGSSAVQLCSTLYKNGNEMIATILSGLQEWMEKSYFETIDEFKHKCGMFETADVLRFERAQFMKYYSDKVD